ncbi:MAG: efflux RND transporter periplasmic adaptor subunit [Planctomycetota bacterium]|nr:efflux RND transporter periplasmic adaptor subunit [Planctomycetota bacterium]
MRFLTAMTWLPAIPVMLMMVSCGHDEPAPAPVMPVVMGKATTEDVPVFRVYPGKTEAVRTMPIHPRVEGILEKVHFLQGSQVAPGQILYSIEREPFESDRNAAIASLASSRAELAYAQSQLKRNEPLVQEGAVSEDYFAELQTKLVDAEAKVDSARANLVTAEMNLSFCDIQMPDVPERYHYRIGKTLVDEGTLVSPGPRSEMATVVQISPIRAVFNPAGSEWPEYLKQSRYGSKPLSVEVTVPTDKNFRKTGIVDFFDNQVDPRTSTVQMWSEIENTNLALMPGQYILMRVRIETLQSAVLIPTTAIGSSASSKFVWIVKEDMSPVQVPIELGPEHGDKTVVTKGLSHGEEIVFQGGSKIRPGPDTKVKIVTADELKQLNQSAAGAAGGSQSNKTGH